MSSGLATREVFWNVSHSERVVFYLMTIFSMAALGYGVWRHIRKVLRAKPVHVSWPQVRRGIGRRVVEIVLNTAVARRNLLAGFIHRLITWGFLTLFFGTLIVAVEYDVFQGLLGRQHGFWAGSFFLAYELVLDSMGILFLVGLIAALLRRYGLRTPHLTWKPVDLLLPAWLLLIGLTGFLV